MHLSPIHIAVTLANLLLGLAVAASAAFVLGRSKSAAGFLGLAGAAYMLGELVQLVLQPMYRHFAPNLVSLLSTFVAGGKNLVFYGGMALAIRALAVASWQRRY